MTTLADSGLGSKTAVKRLQLLLWGPPGTGKTLNAHKLPRTRTLDFDNGLQSVEWAIRSGVIERDLSDIVFETITEDYSKGGHVHSASALDNATDAIDLWLAEEHIDPEDWDKNYEQRWDTLIIDSGSALSDYCIWKGLDENARLKLSKSKQFSGPGQLTVMRMQDWGAAASLFQKFLNWTRSIGKNVVLIAHEYINTDSEGNTLSVDPLLIGQLRQKIPKDFDEVWHARVEGTKKNPEYIFRTAPEPNHRLRSRLGCLDNEEPADFDLIRKKVSKFYDIPEEMLWTSKRGGEELVKPTDTAAALRVARQAKKGK